LGCGLAQPNLWVQIQGIKMVTLQLRQLKVPPGQRVLLEEVDWPEFEAILEELGEHRGTRLAYSKGTLEVMTPLPEHEASKEIISDMVKILLEELEIDRECFGSTTFKREDMRHGIEPDNCFYIQNHQLVRGRTRIDLTVDPPPDLAIEVDVTSKTQLSAYEALGVPELWCYANGQLNIHVLQASKYVESEVSPTFPHLPLVEAIARFVVQSKTEGASPTLRAFRQWAREQIGKDAG
jgi:Uma2 family endonuclease